MDADGVVAASDMAKRLHEMRAIMALAAPLMFQNFFECALPLISLVFISQLGEAKLAASVLAISLFNISGLSIVIGLSGGMETLCGQAYGAGNYRVVGLVVQRATFICLAVSTAIVTIWTQSESLFALLGQPLDTAHGAAVFLVACSPALLGCALTETLKRFLFVQGIATPIAVSSALACLASPLMFVATTKWLKWGLQGAALAFVACQILTPLLLLLFTAVLLSQIPRGDSKRDLWPGFSREALQDWGPYFKLGIPSAAMICLEWWIFEVLTVLSGWLPHPRASLAVVGIGIQVQNLVYMAPLGIASAAGARISNQLGAGNAQVARHVALSAIMLTLIASILCISFLVPSRRVIATLFMPYERAGVDEVRTLADCLAIIAAGIPGDWTNCTMMGVLRGTGRQAVGAKINLLAYWGVGMALVWSLAFKAGWGTRGLWAGMSIVSTIQACIFLTILARMDWQHEARRAEALTASLSVSAGLNVVWDDDNSAREGLLDREPPTQSRHCAVTGSAGPAHNSDAYKVSDGASSAESLSIDASSAAPLLH